MIILQKKPCIEWHGGDIFCKCSAMLIINKKHIYNTVQMNIIERVYLDLTWISLHTNLATDIQIKENMHTI